MFYATDGDHGLPHNPFKALVTPRPIGWITTISADGVVNCAPYSFFNAVASDPPMVMYASNGSKAGSPKDTLTNVEGTGEFVVNVA
ncbi:MAG: flavin reductase, partial [Pseudomonadota bacterium]